MNYLFVVAHPDDETLGAGATIHKLIREGNRVEVAILVGKARARKELSETLAQDTQNAMDILGVKQVYYADFPNIRMNTVPHLELVQFIEQCILESGAEVVVTHHPTDTNNDHVMTSYAAQAAVRLFQRRENVPAIKEFMYMEVLSSTDWALDSSSNRFTANTVMEVGEEGIDIKLKALHCYKGVMRPYPHPRSEEVVRGLAAYRGSQFGCCYAEAFESVFRRM